MIGKDSIESAYCIFHQKLKIYSASVNPVQRDDIEYAISEYVNSMDQGLLKSISDGKEDFLMDHGTFEKDLSIATQRLEKMVFKV